MKAVIPVAGKGTRTYPLGITKPKCLIEVGGKSLLEWNIKSLSDAGISEIILIISADNFGDQIKSYISMKNISEQFNVSISFTVQPEQLGTADALRYSFTQLTQDNPTGEFILIYGDDLYGTKNIKQIIEHDGLATSAIEVEHPERYGIISKDENDNLINLVEKPQEYIGNLAYVGCIKLHVDIEKTFENLELSSRGEYEITDCILELSKTKKIKVLTSPDYWTPVGYPWQILTALELVREMVDYNYPTENIHPTAIINGRLSLPKTSVIGPYTVIDGDLIVGENVKIGPGCYFRGANSLSDNCQIGFNNELKNTVVGKNSKISHFCYFGDSIIGDNVNVGGHSIVANMRHDEENVKTMIKTELKDTGLRKFGTVIGDNSKLGIGTKIYPGRKIWPGVTTLPSEIITNDKIS